MTVKLVIHTGLLSALEISPIRDCKPEFIFITFHSFD